MTPTYGRRLRNTLHFPAQISNLIWTQKTNNNLAPSNISNTFQSPPEAYLLRLRQQVSEVSFKCTVFDLDRPLRSPGSGTHQTEKNKVPFKRDGHLPKCDRKTTLLIICMLWLPLTSRLAQCGAGVANLLLQWPQHLDLTPLASPWGSCKVGHTGWWLHPGTQSPQAEGRIATQGLCDKSWLRGFHGNLMAQCLHLIRYVCLDTQNTTDYSHDETEEK